VIHAEHDIWRKPRSGQSPRCERTTQALGLVAIPRGRKPAGEAGSSISSKTMHWSPARICKGSAVAPGNRLQLRRRRKMRAYLCMNSGKFTKRCLARVLRGAALVPERAQLLQVAAAARACGPAVTAGGSHTIGDCRGFVGGLEDIIFSYYTRHRQPYPSSSLFSRTSKTSMASAAPPAVATSVQDLLGLHMALGIKSSRAQCLVVEVSL